MVNLFTKFNYKQKNQMKISPTGIPLNLGEHYNFFEKCALSEMTNALVVIIHIKMVELDVAKWVVTRSI